MVPDSSHGGLLRQDPLGHLDDDRTMVCNTQIAVSAVDDSESVSGLEPFASPRENERVKSSSRVWSIVRVLIDTSRVSGSRSRRHADGSVDPVRDGDRFDDVAIVFVGARGS